MLLSAEIYAADPGVALSEFENNKRIFSSDQIIHIVTKGHTDTGDWMFYRPKTHPEWPIDPGDWLGFRVTQSYYENAPNKALAIQVILGVTNYQMFLEKNRFGDKFQSSQQSR